MIVPNLSWVDEFWEHAGPYIFSREEDGILILPPNRVYKINETGTSLVKFLKKGGKISSLQKGTTSSLSKGKNKEMHKEKYTIELSSSRQLHSVEVFFKTLSDLYNGEGGSNSALEVIPYTFDFSRLPILGEMAVTYRCNNTCLFCYAGCSAVSGKDETAQGKTAQARGEELSTEDWKKIIRIFKDEAQIPFFSFSGGEPTLRMDLEELISYAVTSGLEVNLVSNGTLIDDKRAFSLFAAGLRTAQISVEAPEPILHDYLAGRKGAFTETVRGIESLINAGVSVQTNTTITRANSEASLIMPEFLAGMGIKRFAMNMYIPAGLKPGQNPRDDLAIAYDEIGRVVDGVRKAAFMAGLTFYWYSPTPLCHYNPIARGMGNKSCAAADGLISVAANGDLLPCSSWDEPLGNLLNNPFRDLWFSKRALFFKYKQFAPDKCKECSAFAACQGACPIYWQSYGDGLLSDKRSKEKRNES